MILSELDYVALLVIGFAYLLAGLSKGAIGFGLPVIAIPLVATVLPTQVAIALTAAPILLSNSYQALHRADPVGAVRRFWPLIVAMLVGSTIGAQILTRIDQHTASIVVGTVLLCFVCLQGFSIRPEISRRGERILKPFVGMASGLLGGTTGILGPPFLIFLVALRLPKDVFVGTIGLLYFVGIIPVYATLVYTGLIARDEAILSGLACIPLFAGIFAGVWLRGRISAKLFQRVLLAGIFVIGVNLVRRGFA
ncbi:MAG: sulfite exporter TauE/SafE family protein [Alphaproteobacteria bacterium]